MSTKRKAICGMYKYALYLEVRREMEHVYEINLRQF